MIGSIALPETPAVRADAPPLPRRLLLVGNPNVGKSALFRALTGRQVLVSNFPGTTVEIARAAARSAGAATEIVDTPGISDLDEREDEARAVRQVLSSDPDAVVVQVADAKNLRRPCC